MRRQFRQGNEVMEPALKLAETVFGKTSDVLQRRKFWEELASQIECVLSCRIKIVSSPAPEFEKSAVTWSLISHVSVDWPNPTRYAEPQHIIIYGAKLSSAVVARCVGHELYHILAHNPLSPNHQITEDKKVTYTNGEEREADIFSLWVLMRSFPNNDDNQNAYINTLKSEGLSPHLAGSEIEEIVSWLSGNYA